MSDSYPQQQPPQYGGPNQQPPQYSGAPQYQGGQGQMGQPTPGPRPALVSRGMMLIYSGIGLAALSAIIGAFATTAQFEDVEGVSAGQFSVFVVIFSLLIYAGGAVVAYFAGKGQNWARITSTVFAGIAVIQLLSAFLNVIAADGMLIVVNLLMALACVVYAVGHVFLWNAQANAWYRSTPR